MLCISKCCIIDLGWPTWVNLLLSKMVYQHDKRDIMAYIGLGRQAFGNMETSPVPSSAPKFLRPQVAEGQHVQCSGSVLISWISLYRLIYEGYGHAKLLTNEIRCQEIIESFWNQVRFLHEPISSALGECKQQQTLRGVVVASTTMLLSNHTSLEEWQPSMIW